MLRKSSGLDDPLRIHDMKVPPSVYNRARQHQKVTTLGRVSTANRVLLRRKTAVTSDADETCRLRSLSAEEKRIIEKIRGGGGGGATGPTGGGSGGSHKGYSADESGLELSRNVRLTFTGNPAVSCGNLAVNQARARRAMESARRPPAAVSAAVAATVKPQNRTPAIVASSRRRTPPSGVNTCHSGCCGGSRPRSLSTGKVAAAGFKSRDSAIAGKEVTHIVRQASDGSSQSHQSQLKDASSSSRHAMCRQHPSYSRETSILKETCRSAETPDQISARTLSSPSCSPTASAPALLAAGKQVVDQRISALDMRGANAQAVDTVASLSSWVCTGSALLRQISAAREGTPSTIGDLRPSQLGASQELHHQEQDKAQQQQQQLQMLDDWDPAEVNVSRLIRRRHLEALLSVGGSHELLDQLLD